MNTETKTVLSAIDALRKAETALAIVCSYRDGMNNSDRQRAQAALEGARAALTAYDTGAIEPGLLAALKAVVGWLDQPVQHSGTMDRSAVAIIRGDCAVAKRIAMAAIQAAGAAGPRKVWLVEAEHFNVPGRHVSVHVTKAGADARAAEKINLILTDSRVCYPDIDHPKDATADAWEEAAQWLENLHGAANCYVTVTELEILP
jgi:hypothetical protein